MFFLLFPFCLQADAPIDPVDKNKTTPLHLSARYGHEKTAQMLINRGASLTHADNMGHNALTLSILHGKRQKQHSLFF